MPKSKKPKLTLVKGGVQSFEDFKRMMNTMSQSLLGRPMSASDEEWKKEYEEFVKADESKNDQQDESKK